MTSVQSPLNSMAYSARPSTPSKRQPPTLPALSATNKALNPLTTVQPIQAGVAAGHHYHPDLLSPVTQNGSFEFDRVLKSGKILRRTKKKGAWKPSWKVTYLVLRPNLLSVYKNADETQLRASITLSDVTAVARVKKSKSDNVFGVFTPAKNYHFAAKNERELSDWVSILRIESRTGDEDEQLDLPLPGILQNANSESTDLSGEEELEPPGSPEGPSWAIRDGKSRAGTTSSAGRKVSIPQPSRLRDFSGTTTIGTEAFSTSQSDLSDGAAGRANSVNAMATTPIPTTALSSSIPKSSFLSPVSDAGTTNPPRSPSGASPSGRPSFQRSTSQLSISTQPPQSDKPVDPNRVIRHGRLLLLKTVSGVRQWKQIWAVLRPKSLSMYKDSSEYEPLKIIPISDLIDAAEIDPVSKSKPFCFQIIGVEKTIKYAVEDENELEGWLGGLKSVLAKRTRARGLSSAHGQSQAATGATATTAAAAGAATPSTTASPSSAGPSGQSSNPNSSLPHSQVSPSTASTAGNHTYTTSTQITRPKSSLDGIIEGTEDMTVQ